MHSSTKGSMMGRNRDNDRLACYEHVGEQYGLTMKMVRSREKRFWRKDQEING